MKLSATHAFNCIVLSVKFGWTSCEEIPPALTDMGDMLGITHVIAIPQQIL